MQTENSWDSQTIVKPNMSLILKRKDKNYMDLTYYQFKKSRKKWKDKSEKEEGVNKSKNKSSGENHYEKG